MKTENDKLNRREKQTTERRIEEGKKNPYWELELDE